ncbi:MAG: hypothetical protein N3D10_00915 [Candidatus Micrarchaeota archaeon]|nr:hypothetical protein [Candidatus Micrarchaeota archaeon]
MDSLTFFKKLGKIKVYKINSQAYPENSYVICHPSFAEVLYKPFCAGISLQNKMQRASLEFAKALKFLCLKNQIEKKTVVELVLLSGGLFYNLNFAFKKLYNFSLQQCFLGISRYMLKEKFGEFDAKIDYSNFEALPDNATVLIGDTLATGATLSKAVEHLKQVSEEQNKKIRSIFFVTLAGSKKGAIAFKNATKKFENISSAIIFAHQVFHLMPDGTDLRFFGPDALAPLESINKTKKLYGEKLGHEFKCAVFDWGTRCKNPLAHYEEFENYIENFSRTLSDKNSLKVLDGLLKEVKKEKKAYSGTI